MDNNKIVLIKGNGSQFYEQVIFVLKSPRAAAKKDLVSEAEKILNSYLYSGNASYGHSAYEKYKNGVSARVIEKKEQQADAVAKAPKAARTKAKYDFTAIFITAVLVIFCTLFGVILNNMF